MAGNSNLDLSGMALLGIDYIHKKCHVPLREICIIKNGQAVSYAITTG